MFDAQACLRTAALALLALGWLGLPVAEAGWRDDDPVLSVEAVPGTNVQRVSAVYSSSVLIFKVGEVSLDAVFSDSAYEADSFVEAAGLAALFTDFDIRARVAGERGNGQARPSSYTHVERTGDKVRTVRVAFEDALAVSEAEPPFGSLGQPPAGPADRTDVLDPMTAFFALSDRMGAEEGQACQGRLPVFDGKQRYDLRLVDAGLSRIRTRAWQGEARVCEAYYEPISGYDPEDYPTPSELRHPLTIWIAEFPETGIFLPVRLHTRAGFGGVTIEAREILIETL
ncbi:DUF3108 domain-containing protein [Maricaulis parjimensis]|uniref:DUF3108 domain-containing protein n=1 Tax=Maricaulis parjimensis TaxID=144023 RepID=UPI00193A2ED9|nr:DUF3108 domain-containing protein [Maricaulis parjimensis]